VIRDTAKAFEAFRKGEIDRFVLTLPEYWYEKLPDDDPLVRDGYVAKAVFYNEIPTADLRPVDEHRPGRCSTTATSASASSTPRTGTS
jgi:hypothetical protein